jgi:hypothetical protein
VGGNCLHATPCVDRIPGLANRRLGSGRTRLRGVEAEGNPPDGAPEQSHHKTRQSSIRNELYPVAAALNRSQKRNSVSPPEPEPDEQDGSFELSRLVNQRPATGDTGGTAGKPTFTGPERSRTLPVETAVSDCTSPGAGDRRDPDWLPDG